MLVFIGFFLWGCMLLSRSTHAGRLHYAGTAHVAVLNESLSYKSNK